MVPSETAPVSLSTVPNARAAPAREAPVATSDEPPSSGGGQRAQSELERDVQSPAPRPLVVPPARKAEVHEVLAHPVASLDEGGGHGQRHLVVVPRPAAVQVELRGVLGLGEHAVDEIVLEVSVPVELRAEDHAPVTRRVPDAKLAAEDRS